MLTVPASSPTFGPRRVAKRTSTARVARATARNVSASTSSRNQVGIVHTVDGQNPSNTSGGRRESLFAFSSVVASLTTTGVAVARDTPNEPACSSCEGVVDGTLGRCEGFGTSACRSTFDDRAVYFAAPWEFGREVFDTKDALDAIRNAIEENGGYVEVNDTDIGYIRASFGAARSKQQSQKSGTVESPTNDGAVVLEFLARGENDAVCEVRGTIRGSPGLLGLLTFPGTSEVEKTLVRIRRCLGWAEVPVLRNRSPKVLGYFETTFDDFGPVPPPTFEYGGMRSEALNDDLL